MYSMAAAEEGQQQQKWEGKARAKVKQVRAEQVWPLLEDFCSFDKWLPSIDTCHHVEGIKGKPGLVRYCASHHPAIINNEDKKKKEEQEEEMMMTTKWCHEKLISIDPVVRCLSYEILDNNMGFKSYFATIKVLTLPPPPTTTNSDDDEGLVLGCEIEWCFLSDPVDGMTCEALSSYVNSSLQGIAENIEKAFCNQ